MVNSIIKDKVRGEKLNPIRPHHLISLLFQKKKKRKGKMSAEVEYRRFVGGLAWATNDRTLGQAFSQYGNVIGSSTIAKLVDQEDLVLLPSLMRNP